MEQKTDEPLLPAMTDEEASHNEAQRLRQRRASSLRRTVLELAVLLVVFIGGFVAYRYFTRVPFDSVRWKASGATEKLHVRWKMCDDLIDNRKLIGLNQSQVIALLGKPDQAGWLRGWDFGYVVGVSVIDPVMLVVKFDQRSRVIECDVQTFG